MRGGFVNETKSQNMFCKLNGPKITISFLLIRLFRNVLRFLLVFITALSCVMYVDIKQKAAKCLAANNSH